MNSVMRKRQRGIALMVVLFALLLLSVVGLGMMYSTNMETSINGNYRDKQGAFYAALAGLQEGRDRLNSLTQDHITPPPALPSTGTTNVIYLVSNASTVKPWDNTKVNGAFTYFFDTEFCQEHVLTSLLGPVTAGMPCAGPYSTSPLWYQVYDDNTSATWKLANPLDWKWTRITIKGNNMTPVAVNGDPTSTAQTCWNGVNQMSTPTTYTAGCQPKGPVSAINLTNVGTGYTSSPTITITSADGNGSGATATVSMLTETTGVVTAVTLTTGGVYSSSTAPTVTLSGGGGSGATATATMDALSSATGNVSSITLDIAGSGYTSAPTVNFTGGGGGSGVTAVATIATSTTVTGITGFTAGSQCYISPPAVTFSGGGASTQATATAVLESSPSCIYSWTYTGGSPPSCSGSLNTGQGYSPADTSNMTFVSPYGSISGVVNTTSNHKTLMSSGCCTVTNPGYDTTHYSANFNTTLSLVPGHPSTDCNNFTVAVTVGKRLQSVTLNTNGSGYSSAPAITISPGSGSGATAASATAQIGALGLTGITLTNGGSGYNAPPVVHLTGGGGSGASATAFINYTTSPTWTVHNPLTFTGGSGYTSNPTVTFSGGSPTTPATATATITIQNTGTYKIGAINFNSSTNGGSGYTTNPIVKITDPSGLCKTGNEGTPPCATATATISGGTKFGQVYLLTSYAQTKTGARSMLQMEVAMPVLGFNPGGALTLDGPNPTIDAMPNSMNFFIKGNDANSCVETADAPHPAIDGYDDPNAPTPTSSVATIIGSLPRPDHYTGSGPTPSVANGYAALGETMTDPNNLNSILASIKTAAAAQGHSYTGPATSVALGNCPTNTSDPACQTVIDYVDGDLDLGPSTGYGILAVTGSLSWHGNFSWKGLIFAVGDGNVSFAGGGNGEIDGTVFVSKIWDSTCTGSAVAGHGNLCTSVQSPTFHWNGGGGNGIRFDHCWATNLMNQVPLGNFSSGKLGKMVSFRILPY